MEQNAPDNQEFYTVDMSVGEILRRTREHYGQSLADIENSLHIRASQIKIIEDGDIEALPGRVYAIGFVRSYSEYLGLDGDKMVRLFKKQSGRRTSDPQFDFPVAAADNIAPPMIVVAGAAILAIAILLIWWSVQNRDGRAVADIPDVPALNAQNVKINPEAVMGPPAPQEPLIQDPEGIILRIVENSWVEIKSADGQSIVSRVLKKGEKFFVPDRPDLTMSLGNAGGIMVQVDGADMRSLGEVGEIMRDISLDRDYLKEHYSNAGVN